MTPADLLGLVVLGIATSLGLGVLAGGLLAFGEEHLQIEVDERVERSG
jgi:hypothetical protein